MDILFSLEGLAVSLESSRVCSYLFPGLVLGSGMLKGRQPKLRLGVEIGGFGRVCRGMAAAVIRRQMQLITHTPRPRLRSHEDALILTATLLLCGLSPPPSRGNLPLRFQCSARISCRLRSPVTSTATPYAGLGASDWALSIAACGGVSHS